MIQQSYGFFLKTNDGHRGAELLDVIEFRVTLRWNHVSKWTMTGAGLTPCPLKKDSEIIVYRGSEAWFSGYVTEIEDSYTAETGIYDWSVDGSDDLGKLERRVIYPDPASAEIQAGDDAEYSAEGRAADLILDLIRRNVSALADLPERRVATLSTHEPEGVGEELTITAKYDTLLKYVQTQLQDGTLGIRTVWDGKTGVSEVQLYLPEDVSDTVVFSVEAGSLSGWKRKRSAPKGNVILVSGCEITEEVTDEESGETKVQGTGEWQTVTVQDDDSIAEWGRYELYIQHGDIKPIEEKDDAGVVIYTEPWDSVYDRLRIAALQDLVKNSATDNYELETIDLEHMQYRKHWDLGDMVTVRIGDESFTAPIEEIKIEYAAGIETVTPTIGGLQKGELQTVFDELGNLKNQISVIEKTAQVIEVETSDASQEVSELEDTFFNWAVGHAEEEEEEEPEPTTVAQVASSLANVKADISRLRSSLLDLLN